MWDPTIYKWFEKERARPFPDLLAHVRRKSTRSIADLGCGPGKLTLRLAKRWPSAKVIGVDSSPQMLADAKELAIPQRLKFAEADIATWSPAKPLDLLVSHAALQWVGDHENVIPRLAGFLAPGGTLAVQMPYRFGQTPAQIAIEKTAGDPRWAAALKGVGLHQDSVQPLDWYVRCLLQMGFMVDAWQTTYCHILAGENPVLAWMMGTALRPLLERLQADLQDEFLQALGKRLMAAYPVECGVTLFHFPRMFFVATR
ncbi:MAG TPA: methyltransferase domain-containing protein [Gemmataceae bacterium]|nr:methyltransferase domain-containing protein [Gemmataceae bacterium]